MPLTTTGMVEDYFLFRDRRISAIFSTRSNGKNEGRRVGSACVGRGAHREERWGRSLAFARRSEGVSLTDIIIISSDAIPRRGCSPTPRTISWTD